MRALWISKWRLYFCLCFCCYYISNFFFPDCLIFNLYYFCLQTIQAALKDEATFFQKNYPALASRNGTPFLARTLNKVSRSHEDAMCFVVRDARLSKTSVVMDKTLLNEYISILEAFYLFTHQFKHFNFSILALNAPY